MIRKSRRWPGKERGFTDASDTVACGKYQHRCSCDRPGARRRSDNCTVVRPFAECREVLAGGSLAVWFGYQNDSTVNITVAVGAQNFFAPPPLDRGQPAMFAAGRQPRVFRVPLGPVGVVAWVLTSPDGSVRTATATTALPLCSVTTTTTPTTTTTTTTTTTATTTSTTVPGPTSTTVPASVATVAVSAVTSAPVGKPTEIVAQVRNGDGSPKVGEVVYLEIRGPNSAVLAPVPTDTGGIARFTSSGRVEGDDQIVAIVGTVASAPFVMQRVPALRITAPLSGGDTTGTLAQTVDVDPGVPVASVEWSVDGTATATVRAAPWSAPWDTTTVSEGDHVVGVSAHDAAGIELGRTEVRVRVNNRPDLDEVLQSDLNAGRINRDQWALLGVRSVFGPIPDARYQLAQVELAAGDNTERLWDYMAGFNTLNPATQLLIRAQFDAYRLVRVIRPVANAAPAGPTDSTGSAATQAAVAFPGCPGAVVRSNVAFCQLTINGGTTTNLLVYPGVSVDWQYQAAPPPLIHALNPLRRQIWCRCRGSLGWLRLAMWLSCSSLHAKQPRPT
jgi:hypothetical protein